MKFDESTKSVFEKVAGWPAAGASGKDKAAELKSEHPPAGDDLNRYDDDGIFEKLQSEPKPCGEEDRAPIIDTTQFPWSSICYLIMKKPGGTYRGTGFFVAPNCILTAGHCIYTKKAGLATSIEVIPGRNGRVRPFGSEKAKQFYLPDEWKKKRIASFDYGLIKLDGRTLGERTGHFDFENLSKDYLEAANFNTSGYPSDLADSRKQHFNGGPSGEVQNQRLLYMLDTWKGASGSPVWVNNGSQRLAVGIHNYGHCPNKATRINTRVFKDIKEWIAD